MMPVVQMIIQSHNYILQEWSAQCTDHGVDPITINVAWILQQNAGQLFYTDRSRADVCKSPLEFRSV